MIERGETECAPGQCIRIGRDIDPCQASMRKIAITEDDDVWTDGVYTGKLIGVEHNVEWIRRQQDEYPYPVTTGTTVKWYYNYEDENGERTTVRCLVEE